MLQRGHACCIILVYLARHMYCRKVHVLQRVLMQVSLCAAKGPNFCLFLCVLQRGPIPPPNWVCVDLTLAICQLCCKESPYNIKEPSVTKRLCVGKRVCVLLKGPRAANYFNSFWLIMWAATIVHILQIVPICCKWCMCCIVRHVCSKWAWSYLVINALQRTSTPCRVLKEVCGTKLQRRHHVLPRGLMWFKVVYVLQRIIFLPKPRVLSTVL